MINKTHINNLMENLRLGLYNSPNYTITCTNLDYEQSLVIDSTDPKTSIQIYLEKPNRNINKVTVICGDTNYGKEVTFTVDENEYENILSYIIEWATAKDLNNEALAIDTFSL